MRVDPHYLQNLSAAVSSSSATEERLTSQLSSGLRVSTLSDDPVSVASNALLASDIDHADTFVQTASREQSTIQAADSTLGEVVTQVTKAISLVTQAGGGNVNAANLSTAAKQVADIRDSIVSLANTSYSGTYLFSGSQGLTQPFTLDNTTDPATVTYNGDNVTQQISTSQGQKIGVSLPGSSVFQNSAGDLLGALNKLASDLAAGDTSSVSSEASALNEGLAQLTAQRATLGGSLSTLDAASGYASTQESQLRVSQSTMLSADTAQVATSLQQTELQHQALLSVIAGLSKTNLFDYLK